MAQAQAPIRIGVISDTHIPDRAMGVPQKILEDFKNVDMVIHAGDLVDLSALQELKSVCKKVIAVYGNMDPAATRQKLREKEVIKVGKYKIGVIHGYGSPAKLIELVGQQFRSGEVDIIIFGHSHAPFNEKKGGVLYFNPGSATDKVFSPYNSYGIIEVNDTINARIIRI